jgi:hypothetical protein
MELDIDMGNCYMLILYLSTFNWLRKYWDYGTVTLEGFYNSGLNWIWFDWKYYLWDIRPPFSHNIIIGVYLDLIITSEYGEGSDFKVDRLEERFYTSNAKLSLHFILKICNENESSPHPHLRAQLQLQTLKHGKIESNQGSRFSRAWDFESWQK